MRYSFHGKVRATGQQVDGYVEAETSTEAIDRLADQGIIGVYSVRAEPKQPRNPVLLAGTPEFERALYESPDAPGKKRRALPAPQQQYLPQPYQPQVPLPAPVAQPAAVEPVAVAAPVPGVSDGVMLQLVDKLTTLVGQMQKFLDRPAQVVYQTGGPAREGKGGGKRTASRNVSEAQNSTLKDIFLNNLDLRRSLAKVAEAVTPPVDGVAVGAAAVDGTAADAPVQATAEPAAETVAEAGPPLLAGPSEEAAEGAGEEPPPDGGTPVEAEVIPDFVVPAIAETSADESGDDLSLHVHDEDHSRHAQPAA